MSKPRLAIGTYGSICFTPTASDRVRAETRFRDEDGTVRRITATGDSRSAADRALKAKLATRRMHGEFDDITGDTSFARLATMWLADLRDEGRLSLNTQSLYERDMRTLVMPAFEHLLLREITVRRVDTFLKTTLRNGSYSRAKHARAVLSLALAMAVRYDAIPKNPVADAAPLHKPKSQPTSLTLDEVQLVRDAIRTWEHTSPRSGPRPDGQLGAIVEIMLGTSARIGEVLALRRCDVNVTKSPATVRICGTIVTVNGHPTFRQDHPKTSRSERTLYVPSFTAEALRSRLVDIQRYPYDHLIFFSRNGTPLTTNNVRRQLRRVLEGSAVHHVTPHDFRRTVATVIDRAGGVELAAEMLGHTSSRITVQHYIERLDAVDPVTAEILESLAPPLNVDP